MDRIRRNEHRLFDYSRVARVRTLFSVWAIADNARMKIVFKRQNGRVEYAVEQLVGTPEFAIERDIGVNEQRR